MRSSRIGLACFVCGLVQISPPWGRDGSSPSFEICACCGSEFGYEDATDAGVFRARAKWTESGYAWVEKDAKPNEWSVELQLRNALQDP